MGFTPLGQAGQVICDLADVRDFPEGAIYCVEDAIGHYIAH